MRSTVASLSSDCHVCAVRPEVHRPQLHDPRGADHHHRPHLLQGAHVAVPPAGTRASPIPVFNARDLRLADQQPTGMLFDHTARPS